MYFKSHDTHMTGWRSVWSIATQLSNIGPPQLLSRNVVFQFNEYSTSVASDWSICTCKIHVQ